MLSLIISLGFAFAFVVLLPRISAEHSAFDFLGLHPVYESIWLWVGSGVHSDRATMADTRPSDVLMVRHTLANNHAARLQGCCAVAATAT